MRDITEIQSFLDSERENRDYLESRIAHWESKLETVVPQSYDHRYIVRRLVSLESQLSDTKRDIRLLKIEKMAATAAVPTN